MPANKKSFQIHALTCSLSLPENHQAFVVAPVGQPALASTTALDACRINAKQEKRKRNRENMRKFKKGGRKGTSKKKLMRKAASSVQRQVSDARFDLFRYAELTFLNFIFRLRTNSLPSASSRSLLPTPRRVLKQAMGG